MAKIQIIAPIKNINPRIFEIDLLMKPLHGPTLRFSQKILSGKMADLGFGHCPPM